MSENLNPENLEYSIISESTPARLQEKVVDAIGRGWRPIGGVSVAMTDSENCIAQAMTRVLPTETEP